MKIDSRTLQQLAREVVLASGRKGILERRVGAVLAGTLDVDQRQARQAVEAAIAAGGIVRLMDGWLADAAVALERGKPPAPEIRAARLLRAASLYIYPVAHLEDVLALGAVAGLTAPEIEAAVKAELSAGRIREGMATKRAPAYTVTSAAIYYASPEAQAVFVGTGGQP